MEITMRPLLEETMMSSSKYTTDKPRHDTLLVKLKGSDLLDFHNSPRIFASLERYIKDDDRIWYVIVDLNEIKLITSSGLTALITFRKYLLSLGKEMYLCNMNDHNLRMLDILQMQEFMGVSGVVGDALLAINAKAGLTG